MLKTVARLLFWILLLSSQVARADCLPFYQQKMAGLRDWTFYAIAIFGRSLSGQVVPYFDSSPEMTMAFQVLTESEKEELGPSFRKLYRDLGEDQFSSLHSLKATVQLANYNGSFCPDEVPMSYLQMLMALKDGTIQQVVLQEMTDYVSATQGSPPWSRGSRSRAGSASDQ